MNLMPASTSSGFLFSDTGENGWGMNPFPVPTVHYMYDASKKKVRCIHCGQRQDEDRDDCKFCGAPLPIPTYEETPFISVRTEYQDEDEKETLREKILRFLGVRK